MVWLLVGWLVSSVGCLVGWLNGIPSVGVVEGVT
jgi:hypothetical protein